MGYYDRAQHQGRLWRRYGVRVLDLRGSLPEMTYQHGALLKEDILKGAVPYLSTKLQKQLDHSYVFRNRPLFRDLALLFFRLLQKPMMSTVPRVYDEQAEALARATGLSRRDIDQTVLQADSMTLLLRYAFGNYILRHYKASPGIPGCTSAVTLGEHAADGHLIHGRNMDYPALGHWDPYPTVAYCTPDSGQKFVAITTAGVHSPGITGVNESGLTISTHFHCTRQVSLFGEPVHTITAEIIRRATNLEEAISLAQASKSAGSWSLVLSSSAENKAAVVEMVQGVSSVRRAEESDGWLANTNLYRSPTLQSEEIILSPSVIHDFENRYWRARSLLAQFARQKEKTSLADMASLLADHMDQELGKVRAQGNTISVITTVTSMISQLGKGRFYVANRGEAPVSLGDYVEFQLHEDFADYEEREVHQLKWFQPEKHTTTIRGTEREKGLSLFHKAYQAFHNHDDLVATKAYLEAAITVDPDEAQYHIAVGHVAMKLDLFQRALDAFKKAKSCALGEHMLQAVLLFEAHALDCLNKREEALALYKSLNSEKTISRRVRREAQRCLRRAFTADRAHKMTFDFQFCDSFEYA